jgi:hypothetical protein
MESLRSYHPPVKVSMLQNLLRHRRGGYFSCSAFLCKPFAKSNVSVRPRVFSVGPPSV